MVQRDAADALKRLADQFKVVVVSGPRQSGKTTLVKGEFPDRAYANLEELKTRAAAENDPDAFLARFPRGAILDECQRVPSLLSAIQIIVDGKRGAGQFILTGSQQFGLLSGITQSLAGRAAVLDLLPFTFGELQRLGRLPDHLEEAVYQGTYPPVFDQQIDPGDFYDAYVRTYLERDVRQLVNVRDLSVFRNFLSLCAGRTGQILDLSGLGTDVGVTHNTARSWLSVLEASYVVRTLPAHHQNFRKRTTKRPKLYFMDAGLACWLIGIETAAQLKTHPLRGPLFETLIMGEMFRTRTNAGRRPNLFFWRARSGLEVDAVVDRAGILDAVEIKSGRTLSADWLDPLHRWADIAGESAGSLSLIHGGDADWVQNGVRILPWQKAREVLAAPEE